MTSIVVLAQRIASNPNKVPKRHAVPSSLICDDSARQSQHLPELRQLLPYLSLLPDFEPHRHGTWGSGGLSKQVRNGDQWAYFMGYRGY